MRLRPALLAATAAVLVLAGCGHDIDEATWEQELIGQGLQFPAGASWESYRDAWLDGCAIDGDEAFSRWYGERADGSVDDDTSAGTSLEHACPDRHPTTVTITVVRVR